MEIGNVLLILSALLSALSIYGFLRKDRLGLYALVGYTVTILLALSLLLYYFLVHDFNVKYVWEYSDVTLPLIYLISAVWAGKEGSLLLWVSFLAVMNVIFYHTKKDNIALAISSSVFLFLVCVLATISNPFARLDFTPPNGYGLNPLLRTIEMVLHPPIVFLAYSSMTIPFAITLSGVYRRESWIRDARRWLLVTWLFLTLGIFLGMWWSYKVLGWGGFWGWDPVENASLLPWLTVTALLHGIIVEERRKSLKNLNYWLCVLSFDLVILATFITRSGIITSVHAFAESPVGEAYLLLIILSTLLAFSLWMRRRDIFVSQHIPTLSKEYMLFLNIVLLLISTFTVLLGTLAQISVSVSRTYYESIELPLIAIIILLSGICTTMGWILDRSRFSERIKINLALGILAGFIVFFLSKASILSVVVAICVFSLIGHITDINTSGRRLGGYIAHIGVMCLLIGAIGAWVYGENYSVTLDIGQKAKLDSIEVKLLDVGMKEETDKFVIIAKLWMKVGGQEYILYPKDYVYKIMRPDRIVSVVDIVSTPLRDIYVAMPSFMHGFYFEIHIVPLIAFVWLSMVLLTFGGIYAIVRR